MAPDIADEVFRLLQACGGGSSAADLRAAGLTKNDLDRLVRRGTLSRPARGHYTLGNSGHAKDRSRADWAERTCLHLRQLAAAIRAHPDGIAGYRSAALAWGLPVSSVPARPEIIRSRGSARLTHTRTITMQLPSGDVTHARGLRRTTLERTVVDVALDLPSPDALVTVDAAIRRGVDQSQIQGMLLTRGAVRGAKRARQTLDWADGHSETPIESMGRGQLLGHGIPRPRCNVWIQLGNLSFRVDDLWDELGIVGEADGRVKYQGQLAVGDTLWKEKLRQEWLENEVGLLVVRWTGYELRSRPLQVVRRWERAAARRQQFPWECPPDLITWQEPLPRRNES